MGYREIPENYTFVVSGMIGAYKYTLKDKVNEAAKSAKGMLKWGSKLAKGVPYLGAAINAYSTWSQYNNVTNNKYQIDEAIYNYFDSAVWRSYYNERLQRYLISVQIRQ